jgi:hypothetical protein
MRRLISTQPDLFDPPPIKLPAPERVTALALLQALLREAMSMLVVENDGQGAQETGDDDDRA